MFKVEQTTKEIHLSLMAGCYVICKKKKAQISPVHQLWTIRLFNGSFDLFIYSKCQKPELTVQVVHTGFSTSHSA